MPVTRSRLGQSRGPFGRTCETLQFLVIPANAGTNGGGILSVGPGVRRGDNVLLDQPARQLRHPLHLVGDSAQLLVENDPVELRRLLRQRHLEIGVVEESRVRQARGEHLAVALDDLRAAVRRLDVGGADKGVGELARRVAADEVFLVHPRGELDHFGRDVEERRVEAAEQRHRPFGQPGILRHQPFVLDEAEPRHFGSRAGAVANDGRALVGIDNYMAGAQLGDIIVCAADRDDAGVVETMAQRRGAALDAGDRHRHHLVAQDRDDALQRPHPTQRLGGGGARAPAHRLWPGKRPHDRRDRLRQHGGGGAAGPLAHREHHAVAFDQRLAREAGLAQEAFQRLWRRRGARALHFLRHRLRRVRQAARDQRETARSGVGDDLARDQPGLADLGREQPREIITGLGLHPCRDLFRPQLEVEVAHALHPFLAIQPAQAPFARSRTRPI